MNITAVKNGGRMVIKVRERFDFNVHREFREAANEALQAGTAGEVVVDLSDTAYLDSSALGMLLVLRERAAQTHRSVVIANSRGAVRQVLEIANFAKVFRFD